MVRRRFRSRCGHGIQLLAESEGIFTETRRGVTVGTARKLIQQDRILPDETTVLCITGNGMKTTDVLADKYQARLRFRQRWRSLKPISNKNGCTARSVSRAGSCRPLN